MAFEAVQPGQPAADLAKPGVARVVTDFLVRQHFQELPDPQAADVAGRTERG